MRMNGNTIFITGGTSGIGRGLAEAFHQRGNQVIVAGRREERLREVGEGHPGMACFALDVTRAEAICDVARKVIAEFPGLNCVINNAGVQRHVSFGAEGELDDARLQDEIATNLLGPIRVTAAFLPQLAKNAGKSATIINVSSGLGFVPMARFPVYCASKAAIHSWTMSLRQQVQSLGVKVIEIVPPWVATELGGPRKPGATADGRGPMALDAFIGELMRELETDAEEVVVAEAKRLVAATSPETVKKVFSFMNG
jgi:uncharacterized oxidoreductase